MTTADAWTIVERLRPAARELGYALALHGSLDRDLDVLAVPWTATAAPAAALAECVRTGLAGWYVPHVPQPERKPHGRLAWSILPPWGGHPYIDLSVMPRQPARAPGEIAP